jgi:hypothetical protein
MNPYTNEDVMWQRLKDIQREMENSRLYGTHGPSLLEIIRQLGRRVWWLAGLATRRPPRRTPSVDDAGETAASDAA